MASVNYGGVNAPVTFSTVNAGFVIAATSTYTTAASTAGVIGGKWITPLVAQTATASPTVDAQTGVAFVALQPSQCCAFVWGTNAAGTIKLAQGPIISTLTGVTTTVGGFLNDPQWPALPDDFCPMAYGLVRTAPSASAWTLGTSNWAASGVTCATWVNIAALPARPQSS